MATWYVATHSNIDVFSTILSRRRWAIAEGGNEIVLRLIWGPCLNDPFNKGIGLMTLADSSPPCHKKENGQKHTLCVSFPCGNGEQLFWSVCSTAVPEQRCVEKKSGPQWTQVILQQHIAIRESGRFIKNNNHHCNNQQHPSTAGSKRPFQSPWSDQTTGNRC